MSLTKRLLLLISSSPEFLPKFFLHHEHQHIPSAIFLNVHEEGGGRKRLICSSPDEIFHGFSLSFVPIHVQETEQVEVLASHHDLLLCSSQINYYVCNPLTKQRVLLPLPQSPTRRWGLEPLPVGLICDCIPSLTMRLGGVGTSTATSGRFRVVRLTNCRHLIDVEIFSSETGEWTQSVVPTELGQPRFPDQFRTSPIVHNGYLYWWERTIGFLVQDPFSLAESKWRVIYQPKVEDETYRGHWCIGLCKGRLRVGKSWYDNHKCNNMFSVWEWEEDDDDSHSGKWQLKHRFVMHESVTHNACRLLEQEKPLTFHLLDGDAVYFQCSTGIFLRDLRRMTMKLVTKTRNVHPWFFSSKVNQILIPSWPTTVPLPPYMRC